MHAVTNTLTTHASIGNEADSVALGNGSGHFLSKVVSETDVFRRYSDNEEDEICDLSRKFAAMRITQADPTHPILGDDKSDNESVNGSEWMEFGILSCFPPEILCKILSFLPLKDFIALLCTAKAFNNNDLVRETYLKCVVEELCHRYFGELKNNPEEWKRKRQHFSRHMDTAINRIRQVIPARDIGFIETTLRREPLYIASVLRALSNDGQMTYKFRPLDHRSHTVPGKLINLPDTSKLVSVRPAQSQNRAHCNLTIWDATFDASHPIDRNDLLYDAMGRFLLICKCDVFPDGKMAVSDYDGTIHIFDFGLSARAKLVRRIQPPEHYRTRYHELKVISDNVLVAAHGSSLWLFDLCRPMGCELVRELRHDCEVVYFSGLLSSGELVSFEPFMKGKIKLWQSLEPPPEVLVEEVAIMQDEKHIKEVRCDFLTHTYRAMTLNRGRKIALWREGIAHIKIYDMDQAAGKEIIGSIFAPTCFAPVNTPGGQLLVIFSCFGYDTLLVWQLTDTLPVPVRRVYFAKTYPTVIFSLNLIPDGRIAVVSENNIFLVDLTKSKGREVTRTICTDENNDLHRRNDVAVVSGELSVLAYHLPKDGNIQLLDYYAV